MSDEFNYITEIIPDRKDWPDWAKEAFDSGQFFTVVTKKMERIVVLDEVSELINEWRTENRNWCDDSTLDGDDCANELDAIINRSKNDE